MTFREYINTVSDKKVTVIGIGVSNLPLIKALAQSGVQVDACDKRTREKLTCAEELESLGVRLHLGDTYLSDIQADVVFRTPGVRPDIPEIVEACKKGAELTSEMEVFFSVCPCKIIAVTGSDGKTTTTTLISELLKASGKTVYIGGNIGTPLLCKADEMQEDAFAVVELSSFQLMTMKGRAPDVAVITNVAPNHLDVHKNMEEYVEAKRNICARQGKNAVTVLNYDNSYTRSFAETAGGEIRWFSMCARPENGLYHNDGMIYRVAGSSEQLLASDKIRIPGNHNIENYMAAYAAVMDWVSPDVLLSVAKDFPGVEHRIEFIRELSGVRYYNDSIASSPSRTTAGLRSFNQKVVLIAGGKDKGVPFDELGGEIIAHVKKLVVTGWTMDKIKAAVENRPEYIGEPPVFPIEDFQKAVEKAREIAEPGDVVILSPACTSFDKFKNFEERGNVFKSIVNSFKEETEK